MEGLPKQLHIGTAEGITNHSQPTDRVSDPRLLDGFFCLALAPKRPRQVPQAEEADLVLFFTTINAVSALCHTKLQP